MRSRFRLGRCLAIMCCAMLLLVACQDDDDDNVADQIEGDVIGSPTAAAGLEEDIEEVAVEVSDGAFVDEGIELTEERPTVLHVTNHDDVAYVLRIDPLVNASAIPASDEVSIEFTTPVENTYTGELLPEGGGDSLDTMRVEVANAAGDTN